MGDKVPAEAGTQGSGDQERVDLSPELVLNQDQKVLFWNHDLNELTGLEDSKIRDTDISRLVRKSEEGDVGERIDERDCVHLTFHNPDDGPYTYSFNVTRLKRGVSGQGLVRLEASEGDDPYGEELARVDTELEALNRVLRHDIRNDMTVVLAWAKECMKYADVREERQALRKIIKNGEHTIELTKVAREVLETTLTEGEPHVEPVSLTEYLRNEIEKRGKMYEGTRFILHSRIPRVEVKANEMLSSVFGNILNNAVQHNDEEVPVVEISAVKSGSEVVVKIADNGPGIPDEMKETVFGKNERGLDSPGTGIGLYLVHTLVDQYGGEVWVEDNEPQGSVFKIQLNVA
ncbi:MAG: sensor histidine kinase [Halobacteria archaeon]